MTATKRAELLTYVTAELEGPNRPYWEQVARCLHLLPVELRERVWRLAAALLTEDSTECDEAP